MWEEIGLVLTFATVSVSMQSTQVQWITETEANSAVFLSLGEGVVHLELLKSILGCAGGLCAVKYFCCRN